LDEPVIWKCGQQKLALGPGDPGVIVGILNVTPDSFSDGGQFVDPSEAVSHALAMIEQGAGIIDVGGESTRPGAQAVPENEEMDRVLPVVAALHELQPDCLISIDTSKATVAHAACGAGASIINDVTALRGDAEMASVAAATGAGLVLMHMQGNPRTMQHRPQYDDVVAEIIEFLEGQRELALAEGVDEEAIAFDPGVGFGKTEDHNWEILDRIEEFAVLKRPLFLGVSRKRFLGTAIDRPEAEKRAVATAALTALLRSRGVLLHRVHDVIENSDALRMAEKLSNGAP
jgi:dihydropteroate synthase